MSPCPRVPVSPGLPALRGSRLVFCPCPARRRRGSAGACSHALFMGHTAARATQPPQELLLHPWVLPPGTVQLPPAPPQELLLLPGVCAPVASVSTRRCLRTRASRWHEGCSGACTRAVRSHKGFLHPGACARGKFAPLCVFVRVFVHKHGAFPRGPCVCAQRSSAHARDSVTLQVRAHPGRVLAPGARVCTPQPCREQRARRLTQRRALSQLPAPLAPPHPDTAPGTSRGHGEVGRWRTQRVQDIWDQAFPFSPIFLNLLPVNLTKGSFTPWVLTSGSAFHNFPLLLAQTLHLEALPR